ncbi:TetR/AcrR family transcriptional regulator [Nocardiopsis lambiniae]|uniref:TetR family transcriptional regulator n=1 Tax=Nocardiopsis lambiniae TaxID=3075539 RepID=A0ABU2M2Z9_9ACTN|nr:TetR family transcriptional regulator [Nocardiopsis sp. DSM 44743]MDT0327023.1 TetR family transcriptional regulator [Nocardiopsis sp. DSM 44743]
MTTRPAPEGEEHLPLRERKKRRTRRTLADTALRLFLQRGYDDVTLDELTERAGVSVRTFFRYYSSKEEVAMAAEGELWEAYARRLHDLAPGGPALEQLRDRYVAAVREMPGEWTERYLATRGLAARTPALRAQHTAATDLLQVRIIEALERVMGVDSRRDVRLRLVSDMTLAAVRYGSKNWIRENRTADRTGDGESLIREVVAAFDALHGAVVLVPTSPEEPPPLR